MWCVCCVMWCGVVWSDVVWCGVVWSDVVWSGVASQGTLGEIDNKVVLCGACGVS